MSPRSGADRVTTARDNPLRPLPVPKLFHGARYLWETVAEVAGLAHSLRCNTEAPDLVVQNHAMLVQLFRLLAQEALKLADILFLPLVTFLQPLVFCLKLLNVPSRFLL